MLKFTGEWYDGTGSGRTEVRLSLDNAGLLNIVDSHTGTLLLSLDQAQVEVSARLADSPRYLTLPDGQSVETLDNDRVDAWVRQHRPRMFSGWLHKLESNLTFVLVTLVVVLGVVWGSAKYGVPAASRAVAHALPASLLDRASEETLALMDQFGFEPTKLSEERQAQLQQHFAEALNNHSDLRVNVDFRSSEDVGANAFALPNGQIIFTDQMVKLAQHDDELLAVLGHEIGHVKHRHSLRRLVQNSLYIFVLALITGDMAGTSELILGLPLLFAELAYSRRYETEADLYALAFLNERNVPPQRFADIMLRLEASHSGKKEACEKPDEGGKRDIEWQQYLSTHPMTEERVKAFQ